MWPPRRRSLRRLMATFLVLLCGIVLVATYFAPEVSGLPSGVSTKALPGATYTECGREGGRCPFAGKASVRYGANGKYHYATRTDGAPCDNETFGDPAMGDAKTCAFSPVK